MKSLIAKVKSKLINKLGESKYIAFKQFVRFCLVGVLNTLVDYGVFVFSYNVIMGRTESLDFLAIGLGWCAGVSAPLYAIRAGLLSRKNGRVKRLCCL